MDYYYYYSSRNKVTWTFQTFKYNTIQKIDTIHFSFLTIIIIIIKKWELNDFLNEGFSPYKGNEKRK